MIITTAAPSSSATASRPRWLRFKLIDLFLVVTVCCVAAFLAANWDLTGRDQIGATVNSVSFSRDGELLAAACADGTTRVFDVQAGREIKRVVGLRWSTGYTPPMTGAAISPDRSMIATTDRAGATVLWDFDREGMIASGRWRGLSGDLVVVSKEYAVSSQIRVIDVETASSLIRNQQSNDAIAFSDDGTLIATRGHVWNTSGPFMISTKELPLLGMMFVWPDGLPKEVRQRMGNLQIPVVDRPSDLRKLNAGQLTRSGVAVSNGPKNRVRFLGIHRTSLKLVPIDASALAPSGKLTVTGGGDGSLRLWQIPDSLDGLPTDLGDSVRRSSATTGEVPGVPVTDLEPELSLTGIPTVAANSTAAGSNGYAPASAITAVAFSPDSTTLAAARKAGFIEIWDVGSKQFIATLPRPKPDNRWAGFVLLGVATVSWAFLRFRLAAGRTKCDAPSPLAPG